jgi:hypothetical protein
VAKLGLKICLFAILLIAGLTPVFILISGKFSDKFYAKFTRKSNSVIAGSSVALYGVNPAAINEKLNGNEDFLNYAFTQATSPYGEVYYKAIMSKILSSERKGIHILEVNPLSLSLKKDSLPEDKLILNRLVFFNLEPNVDYILKNNQHPLYFYFLKKKTISGGNIYHLNGWLEHKRENDSVVMAKAEKSVETYRKVYQEYKPSSYRLFWLLMTIENISENGMVVLLRMPTPEPMKQLQDRYCPGFNELMKTIAFRKNCIYLDFSNEDSYTYIDGLHMDACSASRFSSTLGDTMREIIEVAGKGKRK